jgi:hypothetical protein
MVPSAVIVAVPMTSSGVGCFSIDIGSALFVWPEHARTNNRTNDANKLRPAHRYPSGSANGCWETITTFSLSLWSEVHPYNRQLSVPPLVVLRFATNENVPGAMIAFCQHNENTFLYQSPVGYCWVQGSFLRADNGRRHPAKPGARLQLAAELWREGNY